MRKSQHQVRHNHASFRLPETLAFPLDRRSIIVESGMLRGSVEDQMQHETLCFDHHTRLWRVYPVHGPERMNES